MATSAAHVASDADCRVWSAHVDHFSKVLSAPDDGSALLSLRRRCTKADRRGRPSNGHRALNGGHTERSSSIYPTDNRGQ
jgi:hypothetical protein